MNRSKQKGTAGESAIVGALVAEGWLHVERRALHGTEDKGDVAGIPGVMIEAKAEKAFHISEWLREVRVEKENAQADVGVVWFKLPRKTDPREWAVAMTGEQFMALLKAAGY